VDGTASHLGQRLCTDPDQVHPAGLGRPSRPVGLPVGPPRVISSSTHWSRASHMRNGAADAAPEPRRHSTV